MVSPSSRRRAAKYVVEEGLANAAQACRALGLARSTYYLVGQKRLGTQKARAQDHCLKRGTPPLWLPPNYGLNAPQRRAGQCQVRATGSAPGWAAGKRTAEKDSSTGANQPWSSGLRPKTPTRFGAGICSTTRQSMATVFGS
jgi:hypothetical protein